jgi:flagellar basal-body rod protein FlgG
MAAEQSKLDLIAGNLANADAVGFKGAVMDFQELSDGSQALGASTRGSHVSLDAGKLYKSGGPFDMAIDGAGFFVVQRRDGSTAYTRDGQFSREADGSLRNADGDALVGVKIPANALSVKVDADGNVTAAGSDEKSADSLGRIRVAMFASPENLRSLGGTTFVETKTSGHAQLVDPGHHGSGTIAFGHLEKSNVSIMEEMMEILAAQRAFEANSKGVQAADEMQRIANNIQRS